MEQVEEKKVEQAEKKWLERNRKEQAVENQVDQTEVRIQAEVKNAKF